MNNSVVKTWEMLNESGLTNADKPPSTELEIPWFVRLLQGFSGWIAAVLILAFIGVSFWSFFRDEYAQVSMGLALIAHAVAWPLLSKRSNEFLDQLGLAISIAGQFLMAFGLLMSYSFEGYAAFILLGLYQLLLVFVMPNTTHRFLCACFSVISLSWGFRHSMALDWLQLLTSVVIVLVFIFESKWGKRRSLWLPLAYGLACSALVIDGLWHSGAYFYTLNHSHPFIVQSWLHPIISMLLWLYVVWHISQSYKMRILSPQTMTLYFVALVTAGVLYYTTGSLNPLLIMVLGFYRQRPILLMIGVLSLIGFVSWYYYNLQISLLQKSLVLLGSAAVFFIVWAGIKYAFKYIQPQDQDFQKSSPIPGRWLIMVMLLLILAVQNTAILGKERLLQHGQTVLLELAPVDPRSLMQGDYMRLRFALADEYRKASVDEKRHDGFVVVSLDDNNVAQFKASYRGGQLDADERLLRFRFRKNRIQFGTDAFFFQEGTAAIYEQAEYGDFKVSDSGDLLLVGLRNAQFEVLGRSLF
ncbi:GDYXXLXY domain-containing protein [Marinicella sp. W31]|uniref:GDYXXLXY domain-containing protein n=1 Tax=Marinicella sp. W31 TaxID=3023713 RepID=UPI003757E630